MSHLLITAPTVEPVSVPEAAAHLRVTVNDEDPLVASLIQAARMHVEAYTGRALVTQTWELRLPDFPAYLELPRAPFASITSITYIDAASATQTLAESAYQVVTDSGPYCQPARVVPAYNQQWPAVRAQEDDLRVRYVAGYGVPRTVPAPLRAAMLLLVGHLYEHREAIITGTIVSELPTLKALLNPFVVYR